MTTESPNRLELVPETVQRLCVETSDKYVSEPSVSQITESLLQALKRFKNSVRWKEFWHLKCLKEPLAKGNKLSNKEGRDDLEEDDEDGDSTAINITNVKGLGTGLRLVEKVKRDPKGSEDLKRFLHRLETTLLEK
eukprot:207187-Ditylum_brightwellii.AAC.1